MAARVRWLSLQLKFHPSLYVIDLATNVNQFRRAVEREERLPEVTGHGIARSLAVWHNGFNMLHRRPATDEAAALNEFVGGGRSPMSADYYVNTCKLLACRRGQQCQLRNRLTTNGSLHNHWNRPQNCQNALIGCSAVSSSAHLLRVNCAPRRPRA